MTGVARCLNLIGKCSNDAVSTVIMAGTGRAFRAGVDISVSRPLIAKNRGNLIEHGDANITPTKLLPGG
jgi:enoyl-CoA hydratase/carnithine racemase